MTGRAGNAERFALAALTWISEPGDPRLRAAVRAHGAVAALELARSGQLPSPGAFTAPAKTRRLPGWRRAALGQVPGRGEIAAAFSSGLRLICPGDAEWPAALDSLGQSAPLALWARGSGDLAHGCARSVAITGTRATTPAAGRTARVLAAGVSGRGWAVISGGARGIDAAAHRGALGTGRTTIAVLTGGLDNPHPRGHRWLMRAITERGVLVSEDPPGRRATRARLLARYRIIAALANGTVIAAARPRASALEAARCARDLGRPVMAIPSSAATGWGSGCGALILSGQALPVTSGAAVIDAITAAGPTT